MLACLKSGTCAVRQAIWTLEEYVLVSIDGQGEVSVLKVLECA